MISAANKPVMTTTPMLNELWTDNDLEFRGSAHTALGNKALPWHVLFTSDRHPCRYSALVHVTQQCPNGCCRDLMSHSMECQPLLKVKPRQQAQVCLRRDAACQVSL